MFGGEGGVRQSAEAELSELELASLVHRRHGRDLNVSIIYTQTLTRYMR